MTGENNEVDNAVETTDNDAPGHGRCTKADADRREFLQAVGGGAITTCGIGSLSGSALAGKNERSVPAEEVTGSKKKELRTQALRTSGFNELRNRVIKDLSMSSRANTGTQNDSRDNRKSDRSTFEATPDVQLRVDKASVYDIQMDNKSVYGVKFPIEGVKNSPDASVAVIIHDGIVKDVVSVVSIADDDTISEVRKYRVNGSSIETRTALTETSAERKRILAESDISVPSSSGDCDDCAFVVRRICDYGCILGGAMLCGLIGLATATIGGMACSVLYGIYCYEWGYPCYRYGSPRADCDRLLNLC